MGQFKLSLMSFLFVGLVFILACVLSPPANASSAYLEGQVTLSGETYTGNANVSLSCSRQTGNAYSSNYCSDWGQVDSSGSYHFYSNGDSYKCCSSTYLGVTWDSCQVYASQWENTAVANSENVNVTLDCSVTTTQDLALRPKDKTIAVTVMAGSDTITQGMSVNCWQNGGSYTSSNASSSTNGVYNVPVTEGAFTCNAYCDWSHWQGTCPYAGNPQQDVTVGANDTTIPITLSFTAKDKTIRISVMHGSDAVTSNICVSCSQQESPWTYDSECTASAEGYYEMSVTTGRYYCSSYCNNWPCSDLSGSPNTYVTVASSDSTATGSLTYQRKDMRIRTRAFSGTTAITSGITVSCNQQGGTWDYSSDTEADSEGYYECAVARGIYSVSASSNTWPSSLTGYPQASVEFESDDPAGTIADVTLNYLENNATLTGVVTDGTSGLPNVWVNINAHQISGTTGSSAAAGALVLKRVEVSGGTAQTNQVYLSAQTDSQGRFDLRLPAGSYTVSVYPPWDRQDLAQTSQDVTVSPNGTTAVTLRMTSKTAQIAGCMKDASGNTVAGYINGSSYNNSTGQNDYFWKETDSTGCYSASVLEGYTYTVTASPNTWNNSSLGLCSYSTEGMQSVTATSSTQTVNFTIPNCDCAMNIQAVDADNQIVSLNGSLDCRPASLGANEYYAGSWGQMTSGTGTVNVQSDREYRCKTWFWDSNYTSGDEVSCTCTDGASACPVELASVIENAVSGGYVDGSGNPVELSSASYISVYATKGSNYRSCETTLSSYNCDLSQGEWHLGYWIDPGSGFASGANTSNEITIDGAASLTRDLTLMNTASIEVAALNLDSTPRPNVYVECCPYSASQEGANSYQYGYSCGWGNTNQEGTATVSVGATTGEGVVYYCNAYIPYSMRRDESLNNPQECSVTAIVGETTSCTLQYESPDGTANITVTEGNISASALTAVLSNAPVLKTVANASESDAASPVALATVDCFTPAGGSMETTTDVSGAATISCTTDDTWYCVAHNMVANALYVSPATEVECTADGASGTLAIDYVTTVPEAVSQSITDASTQSISLSLSDGFSAYFPPSCLGDADESVTCSVEPVVTPFTANKIPANYYGYFLQCLDSNGVAIQQLNSNATITMPYNTTQIEENLGLTENDVQCAYYDSSTGSYSQVNGTIDRVAGVSFSINHLTDFALVGNGFLGGIQGEEGGAIGKENGVTDTGDAGSGDGGGDNGNDSGSGSGAAAAGCGGCYTLGSHTAAFDDRILWGILLVFFGWSRYRRRNSGG